MRFGSALAIAGLAAATPAAACDLHGEMDYGFLAYINYSGMTPEQMAEAEQAAIQAHHEKQVALAREAFVKRFQTDAPADAAPTATETVAR